MESHTGWPLLLTIILSALLSLSAAKDTIAPGDLFGDGDSLISADGSFKLGFFTPGRSKFRYLGIWYATIPVQTVFWVANRDRPLPDSTGVLCISGNGNLVLSDANGTVYWSTGAATGLASPVARLLNTSNFVVIDASGEEEYAWQSFDHLTDSLISGMKIGWDLRSGKNRNFTSWRSEDDPAPGEYTMVMDLRGDPQPFLMKGTTTVWRMGPWTGRRFSGNPGMTTVGHLFKFNFRRSTNEVVFWFDVVHRSILSFLRAHPTGLFERLLWNETSQMWDRYWFVPRDQCDIFSTCGPFSICDSSYSPFCRCMPGFVPRSPGNWNMGCMRRTPLKCRKGTDGFVKVALVKLPDTSASMVNYAMGLDCRTACLRNCSCTAYAHAEVAGGSRGCILWGGNLTDVRVNPVDGGDELFVRLAKADRSRT